MAATIQDVAVSARVSTGTVSRVLNRHPSVSSDNRRRVEQAIAHLNYERRQRKATMAEVNPLQGCNIMLMLLGMDRSIVNLPVVAWAMHGVEAALAEADANLLIADVPEVERMPAVLGRNRVDALILKGALQGDMAGRMNLELRGRIDALPGVWVLGRPQGFGGDVVQVNDMVVGQMAAEHLLARGHRRLAFVSPKPSQVTLMRRQASFTFYAQQGGATVTAYTGEASDWTLPLKAVASVELVQGLVDRLMSQDPRPTAVFAPDDSVGAMIYRALARRGLRVGRDLSVIACNNDERLLSALYPALTTIDVHAEEIGLRAVDQLAGRMLQRGASAADIGIEPTLVEGESVAAV